MAAQHLNVFDTTHLYTWKWLTRKFYVVYISLQEVNKKEKKSHHKGQILYDSTHMRSWEGQVHGDQGYSGACQGWRVGGMGC